jgi:hypothetical protein
MLWDLVGLNFNPNQSTFNDGCMISGKEAGTQEYTGFRIFRVL